MRDRWQFNKKIFELTSLGTKCCISNTIYILDSADSIVMQYSAIKYLKIFYICFAPDFWTSDTLKPVQLLTVDWLNSSISTRLAQKFISYIPTYLTILHYALLHICTETPRYCIPVWHWKVYHITKMLKSSILIPFVEGGEWGEGSQVMVFSVCLFDVF